jgi:hypothetical protein
MGPTIMRVRSSLPMLDRVLGPRSHSGFHFQTGTDLVVMNIRLGLMARRGFRSPSIPESDLPESAIHPTGNSVRSLCGPIKTCP